MKHYVVQVLQVDAPGSSARLDHPSQMLGAMLSGAGVPGDREIRESLLSWLRLRHEGEEAVTFMEELGLCRGEVRIDVAVVSDFLHGYEIKSDRDSLRRLSNQVALYGKVLDRATLVVGERYADVASALVPAWWELLIAGVASAGIALKLIRAGCTNPALDPRALVELLWLEDARALLAARDSLRSWRRKPRGAIWDRICELYDVDEIANEVRARLKARSAPRSVQLPL